MAFGDSGRLDFHLALFLMRVSWDLEICVSAFTESVLSYFYAFSDGVRDHEYERS